MDHRLIEQCVESLCQKGCRAVWSDIDALEAGKALPEVDGLSRPEIETVIAELKSIMMVYAGSCNPESETVIDRVPRNLPTRQERPRRLAVLDH